MLLLGCHVKLEVGGGEASCFSWAVMSSLKWGGKGILLLLGCHVKLEVGEMRGGEASCHVKLELGGMRGGGGILSCEA